MPAPLIFDDALRSARDLLDSGQYAGVVALCSQQLELRPADVAMLLLRARAWIALGRAAQAIDDLREVLAIDPLCAGVHRALGRLLMGAGDLSAARGAFLGALWLAGEDGELREQLAAIDAALAMEAALAAEAAALEEALALEVDELELLDDAPYAGASDGIPRGPRAGSSRIPRLRTEPMGRASTSTAPWRAPTLPLDQTSHGRQSVRSAGGHGRRAPTQPMGRASTSAAPWRAPTQPLARHGDPIDEAPRSRRAVPAIASSRVPLIREEEEARLLRAVPLEMARRDE